MGRPGLVSLCISFIGGSLNQIAQVLGQPFVRGVFQDPNDRFNNLDIVLTLPNESALNFRQSRRKVRHASVGHGCDDLI